MAFISKVCEIELNELKLNELKLNELELKRHGAVSAPDQWFLSGPRVG